MKVIPSCCWMRFSSLCMSLRSLHYDTIVDFKGFKWLIQTTDYHPEGETIGIILNPDDIHIMHKSQ